MPVTVLHIIILLSSFAFGFIDAKGGGGKGGGGGKKGGGKGGKGGTVIISGGGGGGGDGGGSEEDKKRAAIIIGSGEFCAGKSGIILSSTSYSPWRTCIYPSHVGILALLPQEKNRGKECTK